MFLIELFDDRDGMSITDKLQQSVIDILTPLTANKVPFVTVQSIIDRLKNMKPGVLIDRAFVMGILNPDKIKNISKVEGDRVYLQAPDDEEVESSEENEEDQIDKIKKKAIEKAKSNIKDKN